MRRLMTSALTVLMVAHGAPVFCRQSAGSAKGARATTTDFSKIKQKVESLGIGHRVTVVLRNGNEYYGAIAGASAESFELSEIDLNQKITIAYGDVKKVRSGFGDPNKFNGKRWHPGWHLAAALTVIGLTVALVVAGAAARDY